MEEAQLTVVGENPLSRIIDTALPPGAPIALDVHRNLTVGGILGLALGVGLALLLSFFDRSIKDIKDIEDRVGLPVFGAIPMILLRRHDRSLAFWNKAENVDKREPLLYGYDDERDKDYWSRTKRKA